MLCSPKIATLYEATLFIVIQFWPHLSNSTTIGHNQNFIARIHRKLLVCRVLKSEKTLLYV